MDIVHTSTGFGIAGSWLAEYTLAALGAGVVMFDHDARASQWDSTATQLLGVVDEQLTGRRLDDERLGLLRPDGGPMERANDPVRAVIQSGEPLMGAIIGVPLATGPRWTSFSLVPVFGPDRTPRAALASIVDVTDTFEARSAIADWQVMAHTLLRHSVSADVIVDPTGAILEWNDRALQLTGRSEVDVINCSFADLCDIDLDWVWNELHCGERRGIDGTTYVLRTTAGEVPVFGRFTLVWWPEVGEVVAVQLLDPSDFVSGGWTAPEMSESRIFDEAEIPMLVVTDRCVVVAANRCASQLFGQPAIDLLEQHLNDLIDPNRGDRPPGESDRTSVAPFVGDLCIRRADGDVDVRVSVTSMSTTDPDPHHLLVQLHEIVRPVSA